MKFTTGIAVGFAAGYWVASKPGDERRAQLDELVGKVRDNPRLSKVADAVSRDAKRIGDAVEARVTATADRAGDRVADTIEPNGTAVTTSSGSSATT